jgi:hypothetical protein
MKIDRKLLRRALLVGTVSLGAAAAHAAGVVTDCQNFGTVGTPGTRAGAVNGAGS